VTETESARPVVIGAGWAGLAAAVELAAAGRRPLLLESAGRTGGRAATLDLDEGPRETGQHLLLGGCREVLRLQRQIGLDPTRLFDRRPFRMRIADAERPLRLGLPRLPAPFHLAAGLATAHGLNRRERLAALALARALRRPPPEPDGTVGELLHRHGQPASLVRRLWGPLCLAALNTPPERASARLFVRVLQETFRRRRDSDLLLQRADLGACLPEAAQGFIERNGGRVLYGRRVTGLRLEAGRIGGVETGEGLWPARQVVLATPEAVTRRLLAPHPQLQETGARIGGLQASPLTTVYLRFPAPVGREDGLIGSVGTLAEWFFPRDDLAPGLVAAVISGDGPHMALPRETLGRRVADEAAGRFPEAGRPRAEQVIRYRRGTFLAAPGVDACRPGHTTAVDGLWLAGDYTATGLPATLEGAVRSGVQCARLIQEHCPRV